MIGITLTGVDERTPINDLLRLTETYPSLELGILYTETPEGRNRYPYKEWIENTVLHLRDRCAIHVCGRDALSKVYFAHHGWLFSAGRIQINRPNIEFAKLYDLSIIYGVPIITQWSHKNTHLVDAEVEGHCLLVDSSGGRGISPEKWERPDTPKPVGFAGGLGLDNLHIELPKIMEVATGDWWIDMEGKLRVDDWFSIEIAEKTVKKFMEITQGG